MLAEQQVQLTIQTLGVRAVQRGKIMLGEALLTEEYLFWALLEVAAGVV